MGVQVGPRFSHLEDEGMTPLLSTSGCGHGQLGSSPPAAGPWASAVQQLESGHARWEPDTRRALQPSCRASPESGYVSIA